jgi:hypothetical protein
VDDELEGRPLRLDPDAESASPGSAPAYQGLPVLEDIVVDGFTLGMITDWEASPTDVGDSYVIAPDGSTAGLMWDVLEGEAWHQVPEGYSYCRQEMKPERDRWGVYQVAFPYPMRTREDARKNLEAVLPLLRPRWEAWVESRNRSVWRRFLARFS